MEQIVEQPAGTNNARGRTDSAIRGNKTVAITAYIRLSAIQFNSVVIGIQEKITVDICVPCKTSEGGIVRSAANHIIVSEQMGTGQIVITDHNPAAAVSRGNRHRSEWMRMERAVRGGSRCMNETPFHKDIPAFFQRQRSLPVRCSSVCQTFRSSVAVPIITGIAGIPFKFTIHDPDIGTVPQPKRMTDSSPDMDPVNQQVRTIFQGKNGGKKTFVIRQDKIIAPACETDI